MAKILFFLALAFGLSLAEDCWKTGCQLDSWAEKGCAQYSRDEKEKKPCPGGFKYTCCAKGGGGGGGPPPPTGGSGGGDFVNADQFSRALTSNGYPAPSDKQFKYFNKYARSAGKISTKQEAAMALSQLLHESGGLRFKKEIACETNNCPTNYRTPGCDAPGQFYYGRGYIQLTWCKNYEAASSDLFKDDRLKKNPDQVATDEKIAWQAALWFWGKNVHGQPGVQEGKFGVTTKAINGALECSQPGKTEPANRFKIYGNVRAAFGLQGAGDASGCA